MSLNTVSIDDTLRALKHLERTDWFAGSQQPTRSGVYERKFGFGMSMLVLFSFWDDELKLWGVAGHSPAEAYHEWSIGLRMKRSWLHGTPASWEAPRQRLPWRGLTREWGVQ